MGGCVGRMNAGGGVLSKTTFLLPQSPTSHCRRAADPPKGPTPSPLRAPPSHTGASPDLPEKSHLLVFLLIFTDDLGGSDAHLHTVHHKPAGPLQGLVVQF